MKMSRTGTAVEGGRLVAARGWGEQRMRKMLMVMEFLCEVMKKCSKIDCSGCIILNIPKITDLYNLNREIVWYMSYRSQ